MENQNKKSLKWLWITIPGRLLVRQRELLHQPDGPHHQALRQAAVILGQTEFRGRSRKGAAFLQIQHNRAGATFMAI